MKIEINDRVSIDEGELAFTYSRSSGPGGQNVNKVETRVTLAFDVLASANLDAAQKQRILQRLYTRINKDGLLRVSAQRARSRAANQEAAIERFVELLREALVRRRHRVETKVPPRAKRARLESKQRRAAIKRGRSQGGIDD